MTTKLKKEFTKKCSNLTRLPLLKIFQIYFIFFSFLFINNLKANECNTNSPLNIGLIENDLIDYQNYLYYELGKYVSKKNIEFNIQIVDSNADEFDIIFGEYNDLARLSHNNTILPNELRNFFEENNISITKNILPLDLDTFILVSKSGEKSFKNFEELSDFYDPALYTTGLSFKSNNKLAKLFGYMTDNKNLDIKDITFESILITFKKLYKSLNKNILFSDNLEIYNSFENNENVYTLFDDGALLYKEFNNRHFQLFPQSKYMWNNKNGIFELRIDTIPYSTFGFSAYVNNSNQYGFICHLTKNEVRKNTFKNFNISISPLSEKELKNFNKIPDGYLEILNLKSQNILNVDYPRFSDNYNSIKNIIFSKTNYQNTVKTNEYLINDY